MKYLEDVVVSEERSILQLINGNIMLEYNGQITNIGNYIASTEGIEFIEIDELYKGYGYGKRIVKLLCDEIFKEYINL